MSVEFISILTARAPFQGRPLALSALLFAALLLLLSGDSALAQTRNDFVYWDANGNGDLTCTEARGKDEGLKLPAYADNRNGTRVIYEWLERRTSSDTDNDGIACESTSNPNGYVPGSITPPPPPPTTNARECPAGSATWMGLPVCEEGARAGYDRNAFGSAYSSLEDEIIDGLPKSSGQVYTPYTCKLFDIRADGTAATDIEHIVALAEAYDSGLAESQFRTFAGDLANLTLADPAVNRTQKSDRDAGEWGPPQNSGWFAARVVAVKQKYGLSVNPAERDALQAMLNSDPSRTVTCGGGGGGPTTSAPRTVLLAHFANGNNTVFNSRVYLFNPSVKTGRVTVRVFTLPLMGGLAQELTTTPLELGSLGPKSGLNIKLVEDILTPLGITTPYTIDGGNLTLELTILAPAVRGAAQVFSSDFGFGTYPLQEIPITSGASPTVLVANFMNGNNGAFNSRVYLWNPSTSAGEVTVRVFTLPLGGGLAQELTLAPLALGTLGARSALNVKLAENILTPLGVSLPYTIDGGNLTLEFTIQAADVKGAAQVFSSDFAFGTQPLQEIPPVSGASPTVLVANFTNGNNAAFNSRVYLWNPSTSAGEVTVRVFTLPLADGTVQELTVEPLALDTLGSRSALNIKLAEDILTPLGIATPYTTDGGNLTLEFTIQAADVNGTAQVFSSAFASGTYTLQAVPSVPIPGPTRLVASFTNGNDTVFNSRISLFNPSPSAGNITVRVFTLPLGSGAAQELTTTPLELGTLEDRSALDIRLAEDILAPLGIALPYVTDGGNLTLEFTIQASDVTGTAQVFSSSLSLGTYPLDLSGVMLAPVDEAAFNDLFFGKRATTNYPTVYMDFVSPGRFRETEGSETSTGSYTYRNTGSNTGTLTLNYDDGDRCTVSLTFDSTTAGTASYTCNDGSSGEYNWRLVEIPAPAGAPDLVVQTSSVSDSSPNAGGAFTLSATVRNQGNGLSASTTLRYYRSPDATISTSDTAVGTDAVGGLAASGTSAESISLTAPSTAGTYYYGACVDPVSGESATGNNCSDSRAVTVRSGSNLQIYNDNVVVLPVTENLAAGLELPLEDYAARFYEQFNDEFDFLVFVPNMAWGEQEWDGAFYVSVKNDVQGIGQRIYSNNSSFGSAGKLQGVISFMGFFPLPEFIDNSCLTCSDIRNGTLLHEFMHRWGNFVVPITSYPGGPHWGFSSSGGYLDCYDISNMIDHGGGKFSAPNPFHSGQYSPIELYLAGFIPPEEVPDFQTAEDGKWLLDERGYIVEDDNGYRMFTASGFKTYTIEDIIAEHGSRVPDHSQAQKDFRAVVILLVSEDYPASQERLERLSDDVLWFSHAGKDEFGPPSTNFYEATGGRGTITMGDLSQFQSRARAKRLAAPSSFGTPPPPIVDIRE